jgi:hypothetical protein
MMGLAEKPTVFFVFSATLGPGGGQGGGQGEPGRKAGRTVAPDGSSV